MYYLPLQEGCHRSGLTWVSGTAEESSGSGLWTERRPAGAMSLQCLLCEFAAHLHLKK